MRAHTYQEFKTRLREDDVIFSYSGVVSEAMLASLVDALRSRIAAVAIDHTLTKRIFSIFIEQVQNVIHYAPGPTIGQWGRGGALDPALIAIGTAGTGYYVACGNLICREDVTALKDQLEYLRALDHTALKDYYMHTLRVPAYRGASRGSVGLIEIARCASAPLEYDFEAIDAETAFFGLQASVEARSGR